MTIQAWLQIITSTISLIGVMFLIYHFFRNPDIKADKEIKVMESECRLKHLRIDEVFVELKKDLDYIKNNHLSHIEDDVDKIKQSQANIEGQLKFLNDNLIKIISNNKR